MTGTLDRHERIALQFSGGKDSTACLLLLKPYWDRLTVYWLNSGDPFPETVALMDRVRGLVPRFEEVQGHGPEVHRTYGIPSDIVPANSTHLGRIASPGQPLIQDRYSCCARTIMAPMYERMIQDDITLVIRGQRADDVAKGPLSSGDVVQGVEYFYPIEDWTQAQVLAFNAEHGFASAFYEVMNGTPDCMSCSAWWEEGRGAYLKAHHPGAYARYQDRLDIIAAATAPHINAFNGELSHDARPTKTHIGRDHHG